MKIILMKIIILIEKKKGLFGVLCAGECDPKDSRISN